MLALSDIFVSSILSLDADRPDHFDAREAHHDFLNAAHLQRAHAAFHRRGENLGNAGTLLNQLPRPLLSKSVRVSSIFGALRRSWQVGNSGMRWRAISQTKSWLLCPLPPHGRFQIRGNLGK